MSGEFEALKPIIAQVATGSPLDQTQAAAAFDIMMSGGASPAQMGGLLMAMRVRGETVDEITGAAKAMRAKALSIIAPEGAIDTCGTGGDAKGTYNISTAVSFVCAAAGVPVAKHGNRALSSKSGASDVLGALGVNMDCDVTQLEAALRDVGICFLLAPRHHAAMRHVMPVRVDLATRTIFNVLGPLSNPAGARRQLLGVYSATLVEPLAQVLNLLGSEAAWVVHGSDGLDELTTTGPSQVAALKDGFIRSFTVTPEEAGLARAEPADIRGGTPAENATALRALLAGAPGAYRDIVLLNSAAALIVSEKVSSLKEGAELAASLIDSGAALAKLERFVAYTNGVVAA
jgi:anthranilate phosphoribosyltransferase